MLILTAVGLLAEVRTLTLRQAVELALEQNPDLALARLDEKKAEQAVRLAKDPFTPRWWLAAVWPTAAGFP